MHHKSRWLLFVRDHLLLKITPNIGLWTYTAPRPLQRYLNYIESLRGLDVDIIFPGHGPLFHDLDGRIEELVLHHEERLSVMHEALEGEPATTFEVAHRVFPDELSDHQLRFALAETLAHFENLVDDGRAEPPRRRRCALPGRVAHATGLRNGQQRFWKSQPFPKPR